MRHIPWSTCSSQENSLCKSVFSFHRVDQRSNSGHQTLQQAHLHAVQSYWLSHAFSQMLIYFYFMCPSVLPPCMYAHAWYPQRSEKGIDPLESQLFRAPSYMIFTTSSYWTILIKGARYLHTDFPGALQPFFMHSPWQHHSGLLPPHRLVAPVVLTSLPAAAGISYPISSLSIPALWQFDLLLWFYVCWWIKSLHKSWGF